VGSLTPTSQRRVNTRASPRGLAFLLMSVPLGTLGWERCCDQIAEIDEMLGALRGA
jgi:hypothetical protein